MVYEGLKDEEIISVETLKVILEKQYLHTFTFDEVHEIKDSLIALYETLINGQVMPDEPRS